MLLELCILETQIGGTRAENMAGSLGFNKSFAVSNSGRSGGLGVFWNEEMKLDIVGYSQYHIDAVIDDLADVKIRVTFVYGEAQVNARYNTWDMLRGIVGASDIPWLVLGDFNEVLHAHEHDGVGNRSQAQMDAFRDALDTCGLMDIGYSGIGWTFEKKVTGGTYTRVRLDQGVANPAWTIAFPSTIVEHKSAATSDHVPIYVRLVHDACRRAPRSFKYEIAWERDPGLQPMVQGAWANGAGDSVLSISDKLQSLSSDLSAWDRTHFGNVRREIQHMKRELQELRESPNRSGPVHIELKIIERLTKLYHREEILWRQRARVEWLMQGDKNTYFFHLRASRRRRKNQIKALQRPNGELTENVSEMENLTNTFYRDLYTSEGVHDMEQVLETVPTKVTAAMNESLNAPYSQEEVKVVLFQMYPTKAPGPDGFSAHFFQHHWDTCGGDVTSAVLRIVEGTESAECINDTVLVLIPKVKKPHATFSISSN